jgi:hypothetical protein
LIRVAHILLVATKKDKRKTHPHSYEEDQSSNSRVRPSYVRITQNYTLCCTLHGIRSLMHRAHIPLPTRGTRCPHCSTLQSPKLGEDDHIILYPNTKRVGNLSCTEESQLLINHHLVTKHLPKHFNFTGIWITMGHLTDSLYYYSCTSFDSLIDNLSI